MRINRVIAAVALIGLTGCAISTRTIGMEDPTVQAIRAVVDANKAMTEAITVALTAAATKSCEVPR